MTSSDGAALALLRRAVELDKTTTRNAEAYSCYTEGLALLMNAIAEHKDVIQKAKKDAPGIICCVQRGENCAVTVVSKYQSILLAVTRV